LYTNQLAADFPRQKMRNCVETETIYLKVTGSQTYTAKDQK